MTDKYLVTCNRKWFTLREYQLKNENVIKTNESQNIDSKPGTVVIVIVW
jgi:hypothetical protein